MTSIATKDFCKTTNVHFYEDKLSKTIMGQYLVTIHADKKQAWKPIGDKILVDAEAYWRLRKDLNAAQKIITELSRRMRFIHDEHSIAEFDYPIHEVVSR
ncbi:hypothetical protein Xmau_02864 [Xenorhabdus mauleonii]|uniref:Uncharacterized protein n=1 Tax=Xenorhabdus mauleonii TaxID=351675 RepID=A0A1I3WSL2_9GAMM|nr:hypothetical protein [Xenorhabdus mauleonii]PHM39260.1 hypothetical protein Xmau_02864 [Xenorhabdus mauleonii]SFK09441.1 hypothetical protein SAMN05421680_12849 [Xenorhabdus mauleonii]